MPYSDPEKQKEANLRAQRKRRGMTEGSTDTVIVTPKQLRKDIKEGRVTPLSHSAVIPSHTSVPRCLPIVTSAIPYCEDCGAEMEWSCRACIVKGASSRKEHDKALTEFKKGRDGDLEFSKGKQAGKARM